MGWDNFFLGGGQFILGFFWRGIQNKQMVIVELAHLGCSNWDVVVGVW